MAAPNHIPHKTGQPEQLDGLYGYINYLRESIAHTSEQIRKEEKNARQLIFNMASHYGIPSLQNRDKISENMAQMGVVFLESDAKVSKNFKQRDRQREKNKEKERRRKARLEQEMEKFCQMRKKVKMTNVEEIQKAV